MPDRLWFTPRNEVLAVSSDEKTALGEQPRG